MNDRFWVKQAVKMALAQRYWGKFEYASIVLAASHNDRFLRSTTPFCCGVYGDEKLCEITFSTKNESKT